MPSDKPIEFASVARKWNQTSLSKSLEELRAGGAQVLAVASSFAAGARSNCFPNPVPAPFLYISIRSSPSAPYHFALEFSYFAPCPRAKSDRGFAIGIKAGKNFHTILASFCIAGTGWRVFDFLPRFNLSAFFFGHYSNCTAPCRKIFQPLPVHLATVEGRLEAVATLGNSEGRKVRTSGN